MTGREQEDAESIDDDEVVIPVWCVCMHPTGLPAGLVGFTVELLIRWPGLSVSHRFAGLRPVTVSTSGHEGVPVLKLLGMVDQCGRWRDGVVAWKVDGHNLRNRVEMNLSSAVMIEF